MIKKIPIVLIFACLFLVNFVCCQDGDPFRERTVYFVSYATREQHEAMEDLQHQMNKIKEKELRFFSTLMGSAVATTITGSCIVHTPPKKESFFDRLFPNYGRRCC